MNATAWTLAPDEPFWEEAQKCALAIFPLAGMAWAVHSQSKTVAAFAQLGDIGTRQSMQSDMAKQAVQVDKTWFVLGVMNGWLTAFIAGAWPLGYYLFYTTKTLILTGKRFFDFKKKKQHFLLWDFCYWANFLTIFYCWCKPSSPLLFRVVFMCANGPLAWSVLAFNHAMIFHSSAHITSVVIHTSPLILAFCLRWHYDADPHGFKVCDHYPDCDVGALQMVKEALIYFYLWWMILYYVFIFAFLGNYVEKNGYQTLWDRILKMPPVGPCLQGLLKKFPKLLVQLVYLIIHLVFSVATMFVACLFWKSMWAHFFFIFMVLYCTAKNAASFYFEVFEQHYSTIVRMQRGGSEPLSKKVQAASPALADLQEPLDKA